LLSLNTMLKTVAYQFQEMNTVYANYLIKYCSNPQKTVSAAETWKNLFLGFFGAPQTQYGDNSAFIVLDGVDEAPRKEREMLFRLLKELEDSSKSDTPPRIRVMIVGMLYPTHRSPVLLTYQDARIYVTILSSSGTNQLYTLKFLQERQSKT